MLLNKSSWLLPAALAQVLLPTSALAGQDQHLQQRGTPAYQIEDSYDATNFFDGFEFYSGPDPTEGFVRYQTALEANASSLAGYANGGVFLGVDHQTGNVGSPGRASTRVNTKKTYTRGLFVADIAHMPSSTCGVWAAFWSFGDPWPSAGEIDIIEGVNRDTSTQFTLHTASGCTFSSQGDCNAPGDGTKGCSEPGFDNPQSYGDGFNAIGGGVFATEWTSDAIRMWFFPRTKGIPADLASGQPNPASASWGRPAAEFASAPGGSCDIDSHFREHRLVFNTALCGQWAGKVFGQDPQCARLAGSCEEFVAQNPGAFKEAYWLINSVKVYSREHPAAAGGGVVPVPVPAPSTAPVSSGSGDGSSYAAQYAPAGSVAGAPVAVIAPPPGAPAAAAPVSGQSGGYKNQFAPQGVVPVVGSRDVHTKRERRQRRQQQQQQSGRRLDAWPQTFHA